jgi:hypothetical protein
MIVLALRSVLEDGSDAGKAWSASPPAAYKQPRAAAETGQGMCGCTRRT